MQADKDDEEAEVECKCQLLLVLVEVTLDGSTPLICTPLFAALFCQAASGAVPIGPQTKVSCAALVTLGLLLCCSPSRISGWTVTAGLYLQWHLVEPAVGLVQEVQLDIRIITPK